MDAKQGLLYSPLFVLSLFLSTSVCAQTMPPSADPARQGIEIGQKRSYNLEPAPVLESKSPILSPRVANQKFHIKTVSVIGGSVRLSSELSLVYSPLVGREVTFLQLTDILSKIQQGLFDDGYSLSRISIDNVSLEDGKLVFFVQEPIVETVEVLPGVADSFLLRNFIANLEGKVLNAKYLERLMLLINERLGFSVVAIITRQESPEKLGNLKILLKNSDDKEGRYLPTVSIDNYGSNFTGPWSTQAGISIGSIGPNLGTLSLNTSVTVPLSEMKRFWVSYDTPLFGLSGWSFGWNGSYAVTEPGDRLDQLDIQGKSYALGADLSYSIIRQRDKNWSISAGFDYKNSNTDITTDRLYDDRLRTFSLGTDYSFFDNSSAINNVSLSLSKGFDVLGNKKTGSQGLSRKEGHSDFIKANLRLSRLQYLPYRLEFLTSLDAQLTNAPLLSSEEFGFGGGTVGRGYDSSEITGDKGYSLSIELRKNFQLNERRVQPYILYDFGQVWNTDPNDRSKLSAGSTGLGVRYFVEDNWSLNATVALPLTKSVDNPPPYANSESPRFLLRLNKNFKTP